MRRVRPTTRSPGRPARRTTTGPRTRTRSLRRPSHDAQVGLHEFDHVMGTSVALHLADDLDHEYLTTLADEVFDWFRLVERRFSPYRPDSEVSRLRRGEIHPEECSAEVRTVLDRCAELWSATNGYFDVYATGALDPSGFVKGWAVQIASDRLLDAGCANHRINAGSDVRVRGTTWPDQPWRVGVRNPVRPVDVSWTVTGTNLAVATSDMYERGCHIVDPHLGRPATDLRSVTVVGPDLGLADAYATAGIAMGLPALSWLAQLSGHEAAVVTGDGRCFRSAGLPTAE
jgi:FAD:protein FMN transferase